MHSSFAQKTKRFEDKILLSNTDSAEVAYEYYESKGKRILHNNFYLQSKRVSHKDSIRFIKDVWKGMYENGMKTDTWEYQHQQHAITITGVDEFKVKIKLKSDLSTLKATYIKGLPNGAWSFTKDSYEGRVKTSALTEASLQFTTGILTGAFTLKALQSRQPIEVQGNLNEKGYLDGQWMFIYKQDSVFIRERRVYEDGFLLELVRIQEGTSDTLNVLSFDDVKEKLTALREDKKTTLSIHKEIHPILFDQGYSTNAQEVQLQFQANELLKDVLREILYLDTAFLTMKTRIIGTARFFNEISKDELAILQSLKTYPDSMIAVLGTIKNAKFFELNNQRSDSLAWSFDYLKLYKERIQRLQQLIDFINSESFTLVDPLIFFTQNADFLVASDTLAYNYDGEKFTKVIQHETGSVNSVVALKERLKEDMTMLKLLVENVNTELDRVLKSEKLSRMETILLSTLEETKKIFSDVTEPRSKEIVQIFGSHFLDSEFNKLKHVYTSSNDYAIKEQLVYEILNFLAELKPLPSQIETIYQTRDSIEVMYTQKKLDPYTFNMVETKIKKKLHEKVVVELFEYLLNDLTREKQLQEVNRRVEEINQLQKRSMEFLTENTVALEKRIKPKATPEEMKAIINL